MLDSDHLLFDPLAAGRPWDTVMEPSEVTPTMLPAQRQDRILAEIERSGGARIVQLAELLGVSDMTVRRDIDGLAARGLVKKVYGGATVRPQGTSDEPGFEAKSGREPAAKELIAAAAAALVKPKSTIAVSAGTTTYALAVHLARIPQLTVVTNSIRVADYLFRNGESSQTILLTGGLRTPSDALVGPIAVQTISACMLTFCSWAYTGWTRCPASQRQTSWRPR